MLREKLCFPPAYTNNRLNEGKDLRKDSADIQEKKRRRTVCTSSFFDDDIGVGFLQRYPEFEWLLVLIKGMCGVRIFRGAVLSAIPAKEAAG